MGLLIASPYEIALHLIGTTRKSSCFSDKKNINLRKPRKICQLNPGYIAITYAFSVTNIERRFNGTFIA
jgi:hypothetical protein